jgi:twitching motility protein PilI
MAKKHQEPKIIDNDEVGGAIAPSESEVDIFKTPVRGETFFGFRVGKLGFMVSIDMFCEVLDRYQVNQLPNVQPWFNGLINLRGNLVPVFDLRHVLNEREGESKKRRLFVIGRGEKAVALWIDNYPEIINIVQMHLLNQPPELPAFFQRIVSRTFTLNGQIWLDCQLDSLFLALGRQHLTTEESAT